MTVRELIDLLTELPEECEVVVRSEDGDELDVEAVWLGCDNEDEDLVEYEDEAAALKEENPDMTDEDVWDELDPVVVLSVS
jgi:hypothetical protein